MVERTRDGKWLPGVSPNPGGRPRTDPTIRQALEGGSLAAAERLVALVQDPDPRIALAASVALLDRVLGKPAQALEVTAGEPDWDSFLPAFQVAVLENLQARHADDDE